MKNAIGEKGVVIVGMGFGGIRAARALAGRGHEIVLVDRNNQRLTPTAGA